MTDKKTNCYFNNNPTPKLFTLYKDTDVALTGRMFFKVPENLNIVGCLSPSQNGQYHNIISTIPEDYPQNIYFYSYSKDSQQMQMLDYIQVTVIDMSDNDKPYKFNMLKTDNLSAVNLKFKEARQHDQTPFVYFVNEQQLQTSTILSQFPFKQILITAQPKLVYITIKDNKNVIHQASVGLGFLKKNNAKQLFERIMQDNQIRNNYQNYKVQYEYQNKRYNEDQILAVRAGDKVIIQLSKKIRPEQTVLVNIQQSEQDMTSQPPQFLKSFIPAPTSASSKLTFGKLEQNKSSIENNNQHYNVNQQPNKNSNFINFNTQNNKTKETINYSLNSPAFPSNHQSSQFCNFKLQLQTLLNLVDSDQNDKAIKKLLSKFVTIQLNK